MATAKIVLIVSLIVCVLHLTTAQKPGRCPVVRGPGICVSRCSDDSQCSGNKKCCGNGCGFTCVGPVASNPSNVRRPKPGTCPLLEITCIRSVCLSDYDCGGNKKCCSGNCLCSAPLNHG